MEHQLTLYTPPACTFKEKEFRERDIQECNFWLTTAALLNLEMAILISVLSGTIRLYLPTSEQVFFSCHTVIIKILRNS